MLTEINQSLIQKLNRLEKGEDLSVAFPAPPAPFRAAQLSLSTRRRAVTGRTARLRVRFAKNPWKLIPKTFKISPNILVEGQPVRKSRFFCGFLIWNFQAASHFLPPELKVRLRGAQSSAPMVKLSYHWAEQPIFCISPKAKLPNFRKESDNFSVLCTVCPKAITT